MSILETVAMDALEKAEPDIKRALLQTIVNVTQHETPLKAAEQAVICTASRRLSIAAIKAALKVKAKL